MIKGWFIYNNSLIGKKYSDIYALYSDAAKRMNIKMEFLGNADFHHCIENGKIVASPLGKSDIPDFVLYMCKDIMLAKTLEMMGLRVFNSSETIRICDDKALTYQFLANKITEMPKTLFPHLLFEGVPESENVRDIHLNHIEAELGYPMVIKESFGSYGHQVYLVNNREELNERYEKIKYTPHLYQEFISSSKGRDIRLQLVGGKVRASMLRTSDTDFRSNLSSGGKMHKCEPSREFINMAEKISDLLNADFVGIDLMFDENENPIFCEANSNAHIKNITECTGIDVAGEIFSYIAGNI